MKKFLNFTALVLLWSCNNDNSKNSTAKADEEATASHACYMFANNNDTIDLRINYSGESITGTLVYKLHEKDMNRGTIQGYMKGDLLIADYTFMSEGVESERQVAFKKVDNSFIEGYGEVVTSGDKVSFSNIDSLEFNTRFLLSKIDCPAK